MTLFLLSLGCFALILFVVELFQKFFDVIEAVFMVESFMREGSNERKFCQPISAQY